MSRVSSRVGVDIFAVKVFRIVFAVRGWEFFACWFRVVGDV